MTEVRALPGTLGLTSLVPGNKAKVYFLVTTDFFAFPLFSPHTIKYTCILAVPQANILSLSLSLSFLSSMYVDL